MRNNELALDQATARHKDDNGFLHVSETNITKETVNPYYGREIPGWREAGLDPNRIYYGYRSGDELAKAARTFDGLPVQSGHHPDSAENPQKEFRVGSVGTGTRWEPPYLKAPLIITDQSAIDDIENGRARELSCAYAYTPDFQHGTHDGISYDFIMRDIKGNHVALVEAGRAGPDVLVADAALKEPAGEKNIKTKVGELLMSIFNRRFRGAQDGDPEVEKKEVELAQAIIDLHKTNPVTGKIEDVTEDEDKATELKALCDMIAQKLDSEELSRIADGLRKMAGNVPQVPAAGDEEEEEPLTPGETIKEEEEVSMDMEDDDYKKSLVDAADACGMDAESPEFQKAFAAGVKYGEGKEKTEPKHLDSLHESEGMKRYEEKKGMDEEEVKQAMDAALRKVQERTIAKFRTLSAAADAVRPVLGNIDALAFDSAEDIYGAALKRMGIAIRNHPRSAWRSMFQLAAKGNEPAKPTYAQDSKIDETSRFSGLNNIIRG